MKTTWTRQRVGPRTFKVIRWRCCGRLWELLLSKRFRRRHYWAPTCPRCGAVGDSWNDLKSFDGLGRTEMADPTTEFVA